MDSRERSRVQKTLWPDRSRLILTETHIAFLSCYTLTFAATLNVVFQDIFFCHISENLNLHKSQHQLCQKIISFVKPVFALLYFGSGIRISTLGQTYLQVLFFYSANICQFVFTFIEKYMPVTFYLYGVINYYVCPILGSLFKDGRQAAVK